MTAMKKSAKDGVSRVERVELSLSRQTSAEIDATVVRVAHALNALLSVVSILCLGASIVILVASALAWTSLTLPDIYAVSPIGEASFIAPLQN